MHSWSTRSTLCWVLLLVLLDAGNQPSTLVRHDIEYPRHSCHFGQCHTHCLATSVLHELDYSDVLMVEISRRCFCL